MERSSKIYVAGHRGLAGGALCRALRASGYENIVTRPSKELDLRDLAATAAFFADEKPEYVFLAAAKVGGIHANNSLPADFIYDNLAIEMNVIHQAWKSGVKRLLFLGSTCVYPRECPQPIKEEYLLTGPLEPTNDAYAIAKIAGIKMCEAYRRQHGAKFFCAMPTNLYGVDDNYHPEHSHVFPAFIRKFHEGKTQRKPSVEIWGSGTPRREFLCSDDMADGCLFLMRQPDETIFGSAEEMSRNGPILFNIGCGEDLTIRELALLMKTIIGYEGELTWNSSKPDGMMLKRTDVSRMLKLGWRAKISLEEGIRLAYKDFLKNHS